MIGDRHPDRKLISPRSAELFSKCVISERIIRLLNLSTTFKAIGVNGMRHVDLIGGRS